jgi:hypothetical protein
MIDHHESPIPPATALAYVHDAVALRARLREAEALLRRVRMGLDWEGSYPGLAADVVTFLEGG